ncbi:MAG: hypothetical protein KF745_00335 [Phycisphaeraceae bacterium]|nr:hypothetical protein [Phycisphaeraceae bacterium]
MRRRVTDSLIGATSVLAVTALARGDVVPFAFTVSPSASGLNANASFSISSHGSLVGAYDPVTNPSGTRTTPGLVGPFGPGENNAVPATLGSEMGDPILSSVAGGFGVVLDPGAGTLTMGGLAANLIASGLAPLTASIQFASDPFRTRAPDAEYPGGNSVQLPLRTATVTALSIAQIGWSPAGTLTATGNPGEFTFTVVPMITLSATISFLGLTFEATGATAVPFPMQGMILLSGGGATLDSVQPIEIGNSVDSDLALPRLPFDIPTLIPEGGTANLLLDLSLTNVSAGFSGTLGLGAGGTPVPSPAAALPALALFAVRRRRRPAAAP